MQDWMWKQEDAGKHHISVPSSMTGFSTWTQNHTCYKHHQGEKPCICKSCPWGRTWIFHPIGIQYLRRDGKSGYSSIQATSHPYCSQERTTMQGWLRCHFSFSLLRSAVMCLRGSCFWQGFHHTSTHQSTWWYRKDVSPLYHNCSSFKIPPEPFILHPFSS